MLDRISARTYKNAALYPLQADIKDRSQLFTIYFPNDSFFKLMALLSKFHNIYTFKNIKLFQSSSEIVQINPFIILHELLLLEFV